MSVAFRAAKDDTSGKLHVTGIDDDCGSNDVGLVTCERPRPVRIPSPRLLAGRVV